MANLGRTQDQHTILHHQLINQHQKQQQLLKQSPKSQQHNDTRSDNSNVPSQQSFAYKIRSSLQNPFPAASVATTETGDRDYRLNMTLAAAANATASGTHHWHPPGVYVEQIHQQQNQTNQDQLVVGIERLAFLYFNVFGYQLS